MTETKDRAIIIVLFAITFMVIGWISPLLFATYAPPGMIIESHEFSAQNATVDSEQHYVCFDRTVHRPAVGQTFTELYLITDNSTSTERIEITFDTSTRYYQDGHAKVITPLELPDNLKEGEYKYLLVVKMQLADGRVERPFTFQSEPFYIKDNVSTTNSSQEVQC